jgi:hypothetical protein
MGYASMDFQLYAVINGTTVDIVQLECAYEMNTIPKATVIVPVGKYVLPPHSTARTAHSLSNQAMLQVPIQIYVTVNFYSGDTSAVIPTGTYCIFCGWVTGVGYRRTYNSYSAAIECTHWLSALNFSSALLEGWNPNNSADLLFNTLMQGAAGGDPGHFTARTAAQAFMQPADVNDDLWGKCIKPWFLELANDQVRLGGDDNDGAGGECAAALNAFDGDTLPVREFGADAEHLATAICDDISVGVMTPSSVSNNLKSMANVTLWDKLVGDLSARYMFKIIPYPTKAKVVPFIPGLRSYWDPSLYGFSILARDMEMQDMAAHLPRATRGVGVLIGRSGMQHPELPVSRPRCCLLWYR